MSPNLKLAPFALMRIQLNSWTAIISSIYTENLDKEKKSFV